MQYRQKKYRSVYLRFLAAFVAQAFFSTQIILADAVKPVEQSTGGAALQEKRLASLVIPAKTGYVKEFRPGNGKQFIIHVQDAHCNYDAQSNIARIINELMANKKLSLKTIELEGAQGRIDTSIYTLFPDKKFKEEVGKYFLKEGRIGGAEYVSIVRETPLFLHGMENLSLYFENLEFFNKALAQQKQADEIISILKRQLIQLRKNIFSPEAFAFAKQIESYQRGEIEFKSFVSLLQEMVLQKKIVTKDLPNFEKSMELQELSKPIDFGSIETERLAIVEQISKKLSKQEMSDLLTKSLYFRMEKISTLEYFSYLAQTLASVGLSVDSYPEFRAYLQYLTVFESIRKEELFSEIDTVITRIKKKLLRKRNEQKLDTLLGNLEILHNLYHLELTRKDLLYYNNNKEEFSAETFTSFIKKYSGKYRIQQQIPENVLYLDVHTIIPERFYQIAKKRDDILLENALASMRDNDEDTAVVIAGGFHSEGIIEGLRKKDIGYAVISPSIASFEAESPYISIMTDIRTPLEKELLSRQVSEGFTGQAAPSFIGAVSPMQNVQDLVALLESGTVSAETVPLIQRKIETLELFSLLFPEFLKVLAEVEGTWPELREVWKDRLKRQLEEMAKTPRVVPGAQGVREGIKLTLRRLDETEDIAVLDIDHENSIEIGDSFFIPVALEGAQKGIVVSKKDYEEDPATVFTALNETLLDYDVFLGLKLFSAFEAEETELAEKTLTQLVTILMQQARQPRADSSDAEAVEELSPDAVAYSSLLLTVLLSPNKEQAQAAEQKLAELLEQKMLTRDQAGSETEREAADAELAALVEAHMFLSQFYQEGDEQEILLRNSSGAILARGKAQGRGDALFTPYMIRIQRLLYGEEAMDELFDEIALDLKNRLETLLEAQVRREAPADLIGQAESNDSPLVEVFEDEIRKVGSNYYVPVSILDTTSGIIIDAAEYEANPAEAIENIQNKTLDYNNFLGEQLLVLAQEEAADEVIAEVLIELIDFYEGDLDRTLTFIDGLQLLNTAFVRITGLLYNDALLKQVTIDNAQPRPNLVQRMLGSSRSFLARLFVAGMILFTVSLLFMSAGCHHITDPLSDIPVLSVGAPDGSNATRAAGAYSTFSFDNEQITVEPWDSIVPDGIAVDKRGLSVSYDLDESNDGSFGGVSFRLSGENRDISNLGSIVLFLQAQESTTSSFKVEVKDGNGRTKTFDVEGLTTNLGMLTIPLSGLADVDTTDVREINFVFDMQNVTDADGTILLEGIYATQDFQGDMETGALTLADSDFFASANDPTAYGLNEASGRVLPDMDTQIGEYFTWRYEGSVIAGDNQSESWMAIGGIQGLQVDDAIVLNLQADQDIPEFDFKVKSTDADGIEKIASVRYQDMRVTPRGIEIPVADIADVIDIEGTIEFVLTVNGRQVSYTEAQEGTEVAFAINFSGLKMVTDTSGIDLSIGSDGTPDLFQEVNNPTVNAMNGAVANELAYDDSTIHQGRRSQVLSGTVEANEEGSVIYHSMQIREANQNLAGEASLDIAYKGDGTFTNFKIQVRDVYGFQATFDVSDLTNEWGLVSMPIAQIADAGVDVTQIREIVTEINGVHASGDIQLNIDGVFMVPAQTEYSATVGTDGTPDLLTEVNIPQIQSLNGAVANELAYDDVNIHQDRRTQVMSGWVEAGEGASTVYHAMQIRTADQNFSAETNIDIAYMGDGSFAGFTIKVRDINDVEAKFTVQGLGTGWGLVSLPVDQLAAAGLDITQVREIVTEVSGDNASGNFQLHIDGIYTIPAQTEYDMTIGSDGSPDLLTQVNTPQVQAMNGAEANAFAFDDVNTHEDRRTQVISGYVEAGEESSVVYHSMQIRSADQNFSAETDIDIAYMGDGSFSEITIKVRDTNDVEAKFNISGLTNDWGLVSIPVADLSAAGLDVAQIREVVTEIDGTQASGSFELHVDGIYTIPAQTEYDLPIGADGSPDILAQVNVPQVQGMNGAVANSLQYDDVTTHEGRRTQVMSGSVEGGETASVVYHSMQIRSADQDFSAQTNLDVAYAGDGTFSELIVKVRDVNGVEVLFNVTGLTFDWGLVSVPVSDLASAGLDITQIREVVTEVNGDHVSGNFELHIDGIFSVPPQTDFVSVMGADGTPDLLDNVNLPLLNAMNGAEANTFQYDDVFTHEGRRTQVMSGWVEGGEEASVVYHSMEIRTADQDFSAEASVDIAYAGDGTFTDFIIKVRDINGVEAQFEMSGLGVGWGLVSLSVADLTSAGLDTTQIREIVTEVNGTHAAGDFELHIDGIYTVSAQTDFSTAVGADGAPLILDNVNLPQVQSMNGASADALQFDDIITHDGFRTQVMSGWVEAVEEASVVYHSMQIRSADQDISAEASLDIAYLGDGTFTDFVIKVRDSNGVEARFEVSGLAAAWGLVSLPVADLTSAGLDTTQIREIVTEVNGTHAAGNFELHIDGIYTVPAQTVYAAAIGADGTPDILTSVNIPGVQGMNGASANTLQYDDVDTHEGRRTQVMSGWTEGGEEASVVYHSMQIRPADQDFSAEASLDIAYAGDGALSDFIVKVRDVNGVEALFDISGLDVTWGLVSLSIADLSAAGLDTTQIREVVTEVNGAHIAGNFELHIDGLFTVPVQTTFADTVDADGSPDLLTSVNVPMVQGMNGALADPVQYDDVQTHEGRRSQVMSGWVSGGDAGSVVYHSMLIQSVDQDFSGVPNMNIAYSGDGTLSDFIIKVRDINGVEAKFDISGLAAAWGLVTINTADLTTAGLDLTQIREIVTEVNGDHVAGDFELHIDGIFTVPAQTSFSVGMGADGSPNIVTNVNEPFVNGMNSAVPDVLTYDAVETHEGRSTQLMSGWVESGEAGSVVYHSMIIQAADQDFSAAANIDIAYLGDGTFTDFTIKVRDINGVEAAFAVSGLDVAWGLVSLPVANLTTAGLDITQIREIVTEVNGTQAAGDFELHIDGIYTVSAPAPIARSGLSVEDLKRGPLVKEGILRNGNVVLTFVEGFDPVVAQAMTQKLQRALNSLIQLYPALQDMEMPLSIDRDNTTYADVFTDNHGKLTIGIDEEAVKKFTPETLALLLNHEITHNKEGAIQPEVFSIVEDLLFFRNLDLAGKEAVIKDLGMRRYGRFLLENTYKDLPGQIQAIKAFIETSYLFSPKDRADVAAMDEAEVVREMQVVATAKVITKEAEKRRAEKEYVEKVQKAILKILRGENVRTKRVLSSISRNAVRFRAKMSRNFLLGMLKKSIQRLGEDPLGLETNLPLEKAVDEAIEALARDSLNLRELQEKVAVITTLRIAQEKDKAEPLLINDQGVREMQYGIFLVFLQMAGFLRSGNVPLSVLNNAADALYNAKEYAGLDAEALGQLTVNDVLTRFSDQEYGDITDAVSAGTVLDAQVSDGLGDVMSLFGALELLRSGSVAEGLSRLQKIQEESTLEETRRLADIHASKVLQITEDGKLVVKGKEVTVPGPEIIDGLKAVYTAVNEGKTEKQSVYIDLAGNGYLEPLRFRMILEAILQNPSSLAQGITVDGFYKVTGEGRKVYDGSAVVVTEKAGVISMDLLSQNDRYTQRYAAAQKTLWNQVQEQDRAKTLVVGNEAINLKVDAEGNVTSESSELREMIQDAVNAAKAQGQPLNLNAVFSVIVNDTVKITELNKEGALQQRILQNVLGTELLEELGRDLPQHFAVVLKSQDEARLQKGQIADRIVKQISRTFYDQKAFDSTKDVTFVLSKDEAALYGIGEMLHWIVEGTLDKRKLSIIADSLVNDGLLSEDMKAYIENIDEESLADINKKRIPESKDLFEEVEMRIKSQRTTATMA